MSQVIQRFLIFANIYLLLKKSLYEFCDMSNTFSRLKKQ